MMASKTKTTDQTAMMTELATEKLVAMGLGVLETERQGLGRVIELLDDRFAAAVRTILDCTGRVVLTGMGKAGLIGSKISATFSSTGTSAFVLHPVEAIHGDLGMIQEGDVVIALSNSGESEELVKIIPALKSLGCQVILITGRPDSRCALCSDIVLSIGKQEEACPLGLAPSASTTAMLALGDALALTVSQIIGFDREQYAAVHPGGALGRSLMRVNEVMRMTCDCPTVSEEASVLQYIEAVSEAPSRAGAAAIVDGKGVLIGFFTHGDLCRLISTKTNPAEVLIEQVMTRDPKKIGQDELVANALELMREYRIDELPVVDDQNQVVGLLDIQDLLAAGFSLFDSR